MTLESSPSPKTPVDGGFALRGVIEGFYGNPWSHAERLDCIRFIARHGMNTFLYGPKDDPLVRRRWREPYDGEELVRLREVIDTAVDVGVNVVYGISPGLSIRYSSQGDRAVLLDKLAQVEELGVTRFALLLDDLPSELRHAEDRQAYGDITAAHASLASAIADGLGPERPLIVCPLVYHGRGDERYIARLGEALDPAVDILWTGRAICSPVLEVDDANRFHATTGRAPLFWDNYPVNDVAMGWELHIGPYRGRDVGLPAVSRGVLANPMELAEASKIPLATIAEYLADPVGYDADTSFERAIREVAGDGGPDGGRDARAFAIFADNVRSSCLSDDDAPSVSAALASFSVAADETSESGDDAALRVAAHALRDLAAGQLDAADHLLRGNVANPLLIEECRPWIEAFEVGAEAMCAAAELAIEGRLPRDREAVVATLVPYLSALRDRRVRVFGDALDMFLVDVTGTYMRPGRGLGNGGGGKR
jgi:hyaluronoglucosaminidase